MTEGPCRMRKKMVKNHQFYTHYPYRPELEFGDNVSFFIRDELNLCFWCQNELELNYSIIYKFKLN